MRKHHILALATVLVLGLSGCGSDDTGSGACEVKVTGTAGSKPEVTVPEKCDPPKELDTKDLIDGTGAAAKAGDQVTVNYVGKSWSTGKQFDASWDRGEPFPLPLGQSRVIEGWDKGLVGVKAGGRRLLVIPPEMGYGDAGAGKDIKGGETLVFVVDVVAVTPG